MSLRERFCGIIVYNTIILSLLFTTNSYCLAIAYVIVKQWERQIYSFAETIRTGSINKKSCKQTCNGGTHQLIDVNINHGVKIDHVNEVLLFRVLQISDMRGNKSNCQICPER